MSQPNDDLRTRNVDSSGSNDSGDRFTPRGTRSQRHAGEPFGHVVVTAPRTDEPGGDQGTLDGDLGGVADSIGIHYPHEYPNHTRWPNEADDPLLQAITREDVYWLGTRPDMPVRCWPRWALIFHPGREWPSSAKG